MSARSGTDSGPRTIRSRKRLFDPRAPHPLDFVGTFVELVSFSPLVVRCGLCNVEWRPVVDRDGKVQVGYSVCPKGCDQQR